MRSLRELWKSLKAFVVRYPATLSGYIIYSYLFLCIIRFFWLVKTGDASFIRVYETFIAVPFLWLLAFSLVKVIEYRSRLHESESRRLHAHSELETKHIQVKTLHEVIRGVQDKVNNPLEIIMMKADALSGGTADPSVAARTVHEIKGAAKQISEALAAFNLSDEYRVSDVGGGVGSFAVPVKGEDQ